MLFLGPVMRTRVYVDGFNLFYGALKGTPFKWVDPVRLATLLVRGHFLDLTALGRIELSDHIVDIQAHRNPPSIASRARREWIRSLRSTGLMIRRSAMKNPRQMYSLCKGTVDPTSLPQTPTLPSKIRRPDRTPRELGT